MAPKLRSQRQINAHLSKQKLTSIDRTSFTSLLSCIPRAFKQVAFSNLKLGRFKSSFILGKIIKLWPIKSRPKNGHLRKLLINNVTENTTNDVKITVFLLDKYATESEGTKTEDFIIICDFEVENLTSSGQVDVSIMPLQILVKHDLNNHPDREVLISRTVEPMDFENNPPNTSSCSQRTSQKSSRNSTPKKTSPGYSYVTLNELSINPDKDKYYNIYGIVDDCQLRTNTGSYVQSLELVLSDPTMSGFRCTIYASNRKDEGPYPDVHVGNIIRIHRLKVFNVRKELRGKCASHKFVVVFTKEDGESQPKTTAKTFDFTDDDKEKVKDLFMWIDEQNAPKLICDIKLSDDITVIAQIIGIYIAKKTDCVVLKIWDGTKNDDCLNEHLGLESENIDEDLFNIAKDYFVNLFVYGDYCFSAGQLQPAQYVLIRHAFLTQSSPSSNQRLTIPSTHKDGRGLISIEDNDLRVQDLKNRLKLISDEIRERASEELQAENRHNFLLSCDIADFTQKVPKSTTQENISKVNSTVLATDKNPEIFRVRAAVQPGESIQELGGVYENTRKRKTIEKSNDIQSDEEDTCKRQKSTENIIEDGPNEGAERIILIDQPSTSYETPQEIEVVHENIGQIINQLPTQENLISPENSQDNWWKSFTNFASITDGHSQIPPSSISDILKTPAPYKFRVIASVFHFKPQTQSIETLIRLYCSSCHYLSNNVSPETLQNLEVSFSKDNLPFFFCPMCKSVSSRNECYPILEYAFLIHFQLHDTNTFEVFLWREHAVKFFKDVTPEKSLVDKIVAKSVFEMLWKICPNCYPEEFVQSGSYKHYPMLDCCIKSYTSGNGSICYQIFDTILK